MKVGFVVFVSLLMWLGVSSAQNANLSLKQADDPLVASNTSGNIVSMVCTNTGVPFNFYVVASVQTTMGVNDIALVSGSVQATNTTGIDIGFAHMVVAGSSPADTAGAAPQVAMPMVQDYTETNGTLTFDIPFMSDSGRAGTVYYNLVTYCMSTGTSGPLVVNYSQLNVNILRR